MVIARKAAAESMRTIDLVFEILDARIPYTSYNPTNLSRSISPRRVFASPQVGPVFRLLDSPSAYSPLGMMAKGDPVSVAYWLQACEVQGRISFQPMNVHSMAPRLIRLLHPQCRASRFKLRISANLWENLGDSFPDTKGSRPRERG
jgi:hypothetical protein